MEGYVQYRYRTIATGANVQIIGLAKSAHVEDNWIKPVIKHSSCKTNNEYATIVSYSSASCAEKNQEVKAGNYTSFLCISDCVQAITWS
jgi:hypothetical protein